MGHVAQEVCRVYFQHKDQHLQEKGGKPVRLKDPNSSSELFLNFPQMTAGRIGAASAFVFKPTRGLKDKAASCSLPQDQAVWESALLAVGIIAVSPSHWEHTSERSSLIYSSGVCEKEVKTSKRLRNSSIFLYTNSTGEGWELRNRSGDRGCNPDIMPPAQPSSRLSQLKPNSSRTLGRPLPATLLSPNRKAGGTRGQDLRARESWEQCKGSYSL